MNINNSKKTMNKSMKVAYIVPDLDKKGGIQQFAKGHIEDLNKECSVSIINWASPYKLRDKYIMNVLPTKMTDMYSYFICKRKQNISFSDFDLTVFWHVEAALAYKDVSNQIIMCFGLEILEANIAKHHRKHFKDTLNKAACIVACSSYTKNYLIGHYGLLETKIVIISPGIDISKYKVLHKKKSNHYTIGTLTRFVDRKNIINLVKALSVLKKDYNIQFTYHLAGDGPLRTTILEELEYAKIDYKYFGEISDKQKYKEFYPKLDLFTLIPIELRRDVEGFGIVYLEANACGVPSVASDTGGISDAVKLGVSGIFADPKNPKDIADKISIILRSKINYSKYSREWAKEHTQRKSAEEFYKLYSTLLSKRNT